MFNTNGVVENVMIGGPAFASRHIFKGDCIVKVNGEFVQGNDLLEKIIGDDVPGTLVTLTLRVKFLIPRMDRIMSPSPNQNLILSP